MSTTPSVHGPYWGPIQAGLAGMILVLVGRLSHAPIWLPGLFTVGGAVLSLLAGIRLKTPNDVIMFRVVCWTIAAAWSTIALWRGLGGTLGLVLVVVYILFVVGGALLAPMFTAPTVEGGADPVNSPIPEDTTVPREIPVAWAQMIASKRQLNEGVSVGLIKEWKSPALGLIGYTLSVVFERGSAKTWESLAGLQLTLAAAMRLPPGGTVTALPGRDHQGSALLEVAIKLDLDTVMDYPRTYRRRSIINDLPIGYAGDHSGVGCNLYQAAAAIGGMRGAGKTVLLHDMIAGAVQCEDALVCIADLNGGNLAAPWVAAYAEGRMDEPVIDAIAVSARGAYEMAQYWLDIARARKSQYSRLMRTNNVDILPVSKNLPAVEIFVDEGAEVMGEEADEWAQRAAAALRELQRIGRAVCINVIFSVQRATSDYLPAAMKKACGLKIMGMADDDDEIAYMFGTWAKGISADNLRQALFYIRQDRSPIRRIHTYRMLPNQIEEIAFAVAGWRPKLDEPGRRVGGAEYAGRWDTPEVQTFLAMLRGEDVEPISGGVATVPDPIGARAVSESFTKMLTEAEEEERQPAGSAVLTMSNDELAAELAAMEAADARTSADKSKPARMVFVTQLVIDAGAAGIKTEDVVKAVIEGQFTSREQTARETLIELHRDGLIMQKPNIYATWFAPYYAA